MQIDKGRADLRNKPTIVRSLFLFLLPRSSFLVPYSLLYLSSPPAPDPYPRNPDSPAHAQQKL